MAKNFFLKYHMLTKTLYISVQGPPKEERIELKTEEKHPENEDLDIIIRKLSNTTYKKRNMHIYIPFYFKEKKEFIKETAKKYSLKAEILLEEQ